MNQSPEVIGSILGVDPENLHLLDKEMESRTGKSGILNTVTEELEANVEKALRLLNLSEKNSGNEVRSALHGKVKETEQILKKHIALEEGNTDFDKAANLARKMAHVGKGFFLKREKARDILVESNPENLLKYRNCKTGQELVEKEDVLEAMSALRFTESDEWMHETFEKYYSKFTKDDLEERDIDLKVLSPGWEEIAQKFVEKKHHNVSHLKEFGVIFLNPIAQDVEGKLTRDFALLLHYLHEINFYASLFKDHSNESDFNERFKSFLRGDVPESTDLKNGEWFIIQRYLWKINPNDLRLKMPHINPESVHWQKGERDFTNYFKEKGEDVSIWENRDWVGWRFNGELVSFDLEDNAMSLVSTHENKDDHLTYHEHEMLWTKLFQSYAGSEDETHKLLIKNFLKGIIAF
ncbi:MAG: hypothetical protein COU07_04060 [Candidatus Harrisonbacteria bacterium CG10_big_fil_rev_8_21_14_0_10_40_38]|uniref:Uncharacterized protein n=1 Tax=Candidatus Harrisonbacteria bacterium CG10_big_fil_rev_8_21_14_0_10_40_38 TaxID=1974583 RepID=A0A2H0UTB3_9BACT|nr:MAG: hypothetical protein COU07_04060 [Candidatus Harrisonbacteria bacterium CG10_big_fil_rev_8_21_14_0_10_40_38]